MNEHEITAHIAAANQDSGERDKALKLVYDDLLRIARAELARHRRGDTLNTRALVNEAYLKLFDRNESHYENRKHFFATAARAMRQVVIDYARARLAERRGVSHVQHARPGQRHLVHYRGRRERGACGHHDGRPFQFHAFADNTVRRGRNRDGDRPCCTGG